MSDYEIMVYAVDLTTLSMNEAVAVPPGWEPIGLAARQGNQATVLCRRSADVAPPSGAPVLTSLTPNTLAAGGTPATIDVVGSGFDSSSTIMADGTARATFFLDGGHLQYTARPDLASPATTVHITVQGSNGTSNSLPFTYT
jgi:hypothetical protein